MGRCGPAVVASFAFASLALAQAAEFIPLPSNFRPIGISGDGQVVVGNSTSGGTNPYMWTQAGGLIRLLLPNGGGAGGKC